MVLDLVVQWIARTQFHSLVSFISPAVVLFSLLALNFHLETSRRAYNSKPAQDKDKNFH